MTRGKLYIAIFLFLVIPKALLAQDKWEKPAGGIENAQVVIEKDKVIKLRPVSRRFKAIQIEIPKAKPLSLSYSLHEALDSLPSLQVIVRPRTMKDQPLEKFYALNAKLGYGNYKSPYALLDFGTKRSDEYMFNTYLNHYSSANGPVADDLSGEWNTRLGASGKYFLNNLIISSNINYSNHTYSFYGYAPAEINSPGFNRDSLKQKLNTVSFDIGLADNNLKNNSDHDLKLGFNYLSNNYAVSEFYYYAIYKLKLKISDQLLLDTKVDYTGFNQNAVGITDLSRRFVQIKPIVTYKLDKFTFSAGVNAFHQNDPITLTKNQQGFYIYPVASIGYQISRDNQVSIGISGANEKISLNDLYNQNPYISQVTPVNSNINNFAALFKLQGQLLPNFGYSLTYDYKHYDRQMFYTNSVLDTATFAVVYDELGSSVNKVALSLTYSIADKVKLSGSTAYYVYSTTGIAEAWHKPEMEIDFTTNFKITERFHGHLTYFLLNGIKAQNAAAETITLATVHDLNLGFTLSFTERAGVFVDLMNIMGSNYQLYNNYPVKGFQVIGGVSFKF